MTTKIALDESVNEDQDKNADQIQKELEEREMRAHGQILEMIGDLHHANERPPDNILFICKLNPATTSEVCCYTLFFL